MNGGIAPTAGLQFTCMKAGNSEWFALYRCCNDFQIAVEDNAEKR
jgi:hypothetical protein